MKKPSAKGRSDLPAGILSGQDRWLAEMAQPGICDLAEGKIDHLPVKVEKTDQEVRPT